MRTGLDSSSIYQSFLSVANEYRGLREYELGLLRAVSTVLSTVHARSLTTSVGDFVLLCRPMGTIAEFSSFLFTYRALREVLFSVASFQILERFECYRFQAVSDLLAGGYPPRTEPSTAMLSSREAGVSIGKYFRDVCEKVTSKGPFSSFRFLRPLYVGAPVDVGGLIELRRGLVLLWSVSHHRLADFGAPLWWKMVVHGRLLRLRQEPIVMALV